MYERSSHLNKAKDRNIKKIISRYFGIFLIIIAGSFLILYNIDDTMLWKDEAGTAQIGINTIKYGIPKVWDGVNIITSADGNSFNDHFVVTSHGWLQFYIVGVSVALLGKTTLAARLPFAIFGILSIFVMWLLARVIFHKISLANLTSLIYILYIPFILYSRQARYYSLSFFFLLLSTYLIMYLINENKKIAKTNILLALSVMLLSFSNHLASAIWCFSILLYILLLKQKKYLKALIPVCIGGLIWLPWYIYTIITSPNAYASISFSSHIITKILITFWKVNAYFIPIVSLTIIMFIFAIIKSSRSEKKTNRASRPSPIWFFVILIFTNIVFVSFPKWSITNHYLLCVVVATPIILTYFYEHIKTFSRYIALALLVLVLSSNVLHIWLYACVDTSWIPDKKNDVNNLLSENSEHTTNYGILTSPATDWNGYIMPLKDYIDSLEFVFYPSSYGKELFTHLEAPNEAIVDMLKKYAENDETVIVLGIEYEPIVYYTGLRVANTLSEKIKPWPEQFDDYPNLEKYSYLTHIPDEEIDWIIIKKEGNTSIFDDPNFINKIKDNYEIYECDVVDIPLSNSPDLDYHIFSTITDGDIIYIFHKPRDEH